MNARNSLSYHFDVARGSLGAREFRPVGPATADYAASQYGNKIPRTLSPDMDIAGKDITILRDGNIVDSGSVGWDSDEKNIVFHDLKSAFAPVGGGTAVTSLDACRLEIGDQVKFLPRHPDPKA